MLCQKCDGTRTAESIDCSNAARRRGVLLTARVQSPQGKRSDARRERVSSHALCKMLTLYEILLHFVHFLIVKQ